MFAYAPDPTSTFTYAAGAAKAAIVLGGLGETALADLRLLHRGKVRDIYEVDARHLLIVSTDRLSAFDVILPDPIPGKGRILTQMSNFWFAKTAHLVRNHLVDWPLEGLIASADERRMLDLVSSGVDIGRPFFAGPGVPAERIAILRRAFDAMIVDPDWTRKVHEGRFSELHAYDPAYQRDVYF